MTMKTTGIPDGAFRSHTKEAKLKFKLILAEKLKAGDWIVCNTHNQHVVSVEFTRDGDIKVDHDYGNGGEPATSFYKRSERVIIA